MVRGLYRIYAFTEVPHSVNREQKPSLWQISWESPAEQKVGRVLEFLKEESFIPLEGIVCTLVTPSLKPSLPSSVTRAWDIRLRHCHPLFVWAV